MSAVNSKKSRPSQVAAVRARSSRHQVLLAALAGFLIGDLLLHSWDLARSIGADEALPPDAVEATTIGLHHVPPALLRGTNPLGQKMMAAAVEVLESKVQLVSTTSFFLGISTVTFLRLC